MTAPNMRTLEEMKKEILEVESQAEKRTIERIESIFYGTAKPDFASLTGGVDAWTIEKTDANAMFKPSLSDAEAKPHNHMPDGKGSCVLAWDKDCDKCRSGMRHRPSECAIEDVPLVGDNGEGA